MRAIQISLFAALLVAAAWIPIKAQQSAKSPANASQAPATAGQSQANATKATANGNPSQIERGRYIVESVAMCEQCHTQRDENGNPDRAHWLMGGSITMRPAYSAPNWAQREPRIAGSPPGTDEEIIRLLTTGISRTGRPPNPPMPPFRMTQEDAQAVVAYLKSLR